MFKQNITKAKVLNKVAIKAWSNTFLKGFFTKISQEEKFLVRRRLLQTCSNYAGTQYVCRSMMKEKLLGILDHHEKNWFAAFGL